MSKVWTISRLRKCLDTHRGQIVCGLVYCPGGNATDPIWRVLASSEGISSWTPLKPQHSNPIPNCLANQLWYCPVSWGCRIHWLHLCRGVRTPLTSVLDMTLNNLMVRFQQCWSFGECRVPLHCHCSQVHSGAEW